MKKINYLIGLFVILMLTNSCTGYTPIFKSSNMKFEISDYSIGGNKKLGNQIYNKLNSLSKNNKKDSDVKGINININVTKQKNATAKDKAGKALEYKIILNVKIVVKDSLTNDELLNNNFILSSSYKTQDQYSETIKLDNNSTNDLVNKVYQDLLIMLSKKLAI
jgi:hypothetical protein